MELGKGRENARVKGENRSQGTRSWVEWHDRNVNGKGYGAH